MFCTECGKKSAGKFCWNCGTALHLNDGTPPSSFTATPPSVHTDWRNEINYEALLRNAEVRELLAKEQPAKARMTGEQFIGLFEQIVKSPISLVSVMTITQEVSSRLGIQTGKTQAERYRRPIGGIIVSALRALARSGYKVQEVRQATDGCLLICSIPSDMFSLAGKLLITFRQEPDGASVHADTQIEGQLYDWGKSKRCLEQLFTGIDES
jgi:hypothetical protein